MSNPENVPEASEKLNKDTAEQTIQQEAASETQAQTSTDEGRGSKQAVLADLAKERDARQALATQLDQLKTGLATALGISQQTRASHLVASICTTRNQATSQAPRAPGWWPFHAQDTLT